jgi:cell fate regulator YaaT (PSP1 superfamily)
MSDNDDTLLDDTPEDSFDDEGIPEDSSIDSGAIAQPAQAAEAEQAAQPEQPAPAVAGAAAPGGTRELWRVKVMYSSATEFSDAPAGVLPEIGSMVVIPTRYGNELGKVLGRELDPHGQEAEIRTILRIASSADLVRVQDNDMKEGRAFELCREKISSRGLDMKLVSAHYLLDEQKILFLFTAENRVDFRELVKDLVSVFKMRIELRQIGVRDEARVVGGVGICGRALCCNAITDKLRPVSIKMANEQNLTLNSMKISGPCGRLLCCLSYEFDVYREVRHALPTLGTRIRFEGEEFKLTDMNVLTRRVRFQGESGRVLDLGFDSLSRSQATQAWEIHVRTGPADPAEKK